MKNIELFIFETFVFMLHVLVSKSELCSLNNDFQRAYVGLTLTPKYDNQNSREIRIIWRNENFKTGDKIFLFAHSPTNEFQKLYEVIPTTSHGVDETGIRADSDVVNLPLFFEQCRKYYVAWIRDDYIRYINCLSNQPTWMYDRRDDLGSRRLANLFIPGTHNSGTYKYRQTVQSVWARYRQSVVNPASQDLDVMTQLVQGIRYIHVQVGYHPENTTVWWVHKGNLPLGKLDTIINDIRMFLQYTREIVLFDVHIFPAAFKTHLNLVHLEEYLRSRFGKLLPPMEYDWKTPLREIWDWSESDSEPKMGRVLLNFNFDDTPSAFPRLWHSFIRYKSIESRGFQEYFEDLSEVEVPQEEPVEAPLRATLVGFNYSMDTEAREIAARINPDITIWYQKFWYHSANIVALDFFETSGIVDIAIRSNEFRYSRHKWLNKTRTKNCIRPDPKSWCSPEYVMNRVFVVELLAPRIVENAVEKIYNFLPVLKASFREDDDLDN